MMPKLIVNDRESTNVFGARYNPKKKTVMVGGPNVFSRFMEFEIVQRLQQDPPEAQRCVSRVRYTIPNVPQMVWDNAVEVWYRLYTVQETRSFRRLMG